MMKSTSPLPFRSFEPLASLLMSLALASLFLLPTSAHAEESGAPAGDPVLTWQVVSKFVHQFDTDVDGGGAYDADRLLTTVTGTWHVNPQLDMTGRFGYGFDHYAFSGNTGLAGLDPWGEIHAYRFGGGARWRPNDRMTVLGGPTFRFAAEHDAGLDDGFQFGGFAGFAYQVNDALTIGPGVGALTQIEDSTLVFPILFIHWKIVEDLTLSTGRGLGATQGPGLELIWRFAENWSASLGGRYERYRFRLDGVGTAPNGVGQEKGIPLYLGLSRQLGDKLKVSAVGGVHLGGELKVHNDRGDTVARQDYDPAPFVEIMGEIRF